MRRATLLALTLVAGVALAQNPFRDLAPTPEPEPEPTTASQPITIDIPDAPLPAPPLNIDGFPALPAPGALGGAPGAPANAAAAGPTVNVPADPVVFDLPDLPAPTLTDGLQVALRNPLHAPNLRSANPLLQPLPAPTVATSEELTEAPEAAGEEPPAGSLFCVEGAVLATSGGQTPTALIRCEGATHLLRVGDTIPGTDATIESITTLGVTIARQGHDQQLLLAAQ